MKPGTKLGPYEILAPLGAGGMGEVYKARDTRLGRTVAIKVLPAHLAADPERRQRFEREARAVSSLNHPHICTLYDVGRQDETDFLVMEHLEGETLAKRLEKGPLSIEQALTYAMQMADALDKAHRQGVTHRDLKPGNIMLTKAGSKLLDFGLAKSAPAAVLTGATVSKAAPLTAQGAILGTFQYMSPEQLEGKEADARSDLFAFGAVLYEMVTGKKPFAGQSPASVISAIMASEPLPISQVQPRTPPALERLVKTCLAKDPDERRQNAHDVLLDLKWIAEGGSQQGIAKKPAARGRGLRLLPWALASVMAVAAVLAYFRVTPRQQIRLAVPFTAGLSMPSSLRPVVALSPDGTQLAFAARHGGNTQIYLRSLDSFDSRPVAGTEGGDSPFFSPDGQWLGFFADVKLKKVALAGGAPVVICDAPAVSGGAAWAADDTILFPPLFTSGICRVPASGGKPQPLTRLDPQKAEMGHQWPFVLPGGKWFLFEVSGGVAEDFLIAAQSLETGERRTVLEGGMSPRYAPSGHLLFARAGRLMAVRFDPDKLKVLGTPLPVVDDLATNPTWGVAQFSFSLSGTLAYLPGEALPSTNSPVWVDRQGRAEPLSKTNRQYVEPRISPEGKRMAFMEQGGNPDIWVYETARGALTRLTFEPGEDETPVWTPDGKRLAFSSSRPGHKREAIWKPADGSGPEEVLMSGDHHQHLHSFSPDGKWLVFSDLDPTSGYDLWVLPMEGERKPRVFLRTPFQEWGAVFSPDGRWLAYTSNESGRNEVYVQAFPGPGGKWAVSTEGGVEPVWARNGRELFFRQGNRMMAVTVETREAFNAGRPQLLWESAFWGFLFHQSYDVAADGRFLMLKPAEAPSTVEIRVALNWFDELKRRVK